MYPGLLKLTRLLSPCNGPCWALSSYFLQGRKHEMFFREQLSHKQGVGEHRGLGGGDLQGDVW